MEERFETACKDGIIPGVVLFASNRNGTLSTLLSHDLEISERQVHFAMPAHLVSALSTPTSCLNRTT